MGSLNHADSYAGQTWVVGDRFLDMRTPWCTVIGEHWQDHLGQQLDYWRIERADSLIVLPLQRGRFLLPTPMFRPGVGRATLDFPGGRLPKGAAPEPIAKRILQRELGVPEEAIAHLHPLNPKPLQVNSSFSDQHLFGFWAILAPTAEVVQGQTYPATLEGIQSLNQHLTCLQCRALLLEWWLQVSTGAINPTPFEG